MDHVTEFSSPQYDIALSFAGEDRDYAKGIAEALQAEDVNVFYDEFFEADAWGADLYELFDETFRKRARYTIIFVSQHYVNKPWTIHERRSAQARALFEPGSYLLPVRLDDSELPGLRPTVGYVDARDTTPEGLVKLILAKLGRRPSDPAAHESPRVPRTPAEQRTLLLQRPPAWEYLLFAGVLVQAKAALEEKWRDHHLGFVSGPGPRLDRDSAIEFLQGAPSTVLRHTQNINQLFHPDVLAAAFGPPGVPGDAEAIQHLAKRMIAVYEGWLDWAADIRRVRAPDIFGSTFDALARFVDQPVSEMRAFVDKCVLETERLAAVLSDPGRRGEPIELTLELVVTIPDSVSDELDRAITELTRRL